MSTRLNRFERPILESWQHLSLAPRLKRRQEIRTKDMERTPRRLRSHRHLTPSPSSESSGEGNIATMLKRVLSKCRLGERKLVSSIKHICCDNAGLKWLTYA